MKKDMMIGKKFGRLSVLERVGTDKQGCILYKCQCDCVNKTIVVVRGANLRNGHSKSCGCERYRNRAKTCNLIPIIGHRFGKLIPLCRVEDYISPQGQKQPRYHCKCDCGNFIDVVVESLRNNQTQSCGCEKSSIGEVNIVKVLQENNIIFEREKKFRNLVNPDTNKQLRYDFYLPDYNRLIEFDGLQHNEVNKYFGGYLEFEKRQKLDQIKNDYAKYNGIELIRIPYKERDQITIELLLGNKYLIENYDSQSGLPTSRV